MRKPLPEQQNDLRRDYESARVAVALSIENVISARNALAQGMLTAIEEAKELSGLDGKPASLEQWRGKWILLQVDGAGCDKACQQKLYYMRQLRLTQGKEMDRIERVWLITDNTPVDIGLMKQYDGTHLLRVDPQKLAAWLPVVEGTTASDHMYMIDPLGNLMMRFPKDPDANKIKKDIIKLLKASSIG